MVEIPEFFGWSIVALGFVTDAFVHGCKACYLLMVVLESEFGWTNQFVVALVHVFILIMTPISGLLIEAPPNYVIGAGCLL